MRFSRPVVAAAFVVLSFGGAVASAQTPVYGAADNAAPRLTAGWSFTPSIGYAGTWDDNALLRGRGDVLPSDFTSAINPRALVNFTSRRTQFTGGYEGGFVAYRELTTLNSFEQRANVTARALLTRRLAFFTRGSVASVPTTELLGLVAVPFVRLGSRLADARSGVEMAFTRRTSMTASYNLQWVDFDRDPLLGIELLGGHSQGGSLGMRHLISRHTALTADYDGQRAAVIGGGRFNVQNADGGVEVQPSDSIRLFGAIGLSRLDVSELAAPRTGLSWRTGLTRRFRASAVDVTYSRSFVPSYGFGGTTENEELTSRLTMPFGRRFYTRSALSWRRNEPLVANGLRLKSIWIEGTLGYTLRPWMSLEGFYGGTHQNIDRPGGRLDRNRAGFQIITAKPMRIR